MTAGAVHPYTIPMVDDDPDLLQLLTDGLELLGTFRVVQAIDGMQGLEQYFAVHPDCVIIDVKMPGLDGYQLVRALRGDPESSLDTTHLAHCPGTRVAAICRAGPGLRSLSGEAGAPARWWPQ